MKTILRLLWRALPFFLVLAVLLAVALYPRPRAEESGAARIVHVWNVDAFEGGKGSRTAFLRRAAKVAERSREGVRYLVTSVTSEGLYDALGKGELPDVLSFGGSVEGLEELCLPLGVRFAGSERALPWCRGQYFLFSMTDDFTQAGDTAISAGGSNLSAVAAYFAEITGKEAPSLNAYIDFLGGKYRYLLGTQRDACRFAARGQTVYSRPLNDFCDLYMYVSVLTRERGDDCLHFVETLRSDGVQCLLEEIGMYPAADAAGLTTGAFFSAEEAARLADAVRAGAPRKNIEKFLKTV